VAEATDNSAIAKGNPMPKPYTAEQIAALAAGIDLNTIAAVVAPVEGAAPVVLTPADPVVAAAPVAVAAPVVPDALATLQSMLTSALTEKAGVTAQLAAAEQAVTAATAATEAAKAAALPYIEIVRSSVKTMGVALNTPADVSAMTPEQVLAQHATFTASFQAKFKGGAVAATNTAVDPAKASAPAFSAVAAARFQSLKSAK
jgi:Meckel syndrome type 1 protein